MIRQAGDQLIKFRLNNDQVRPASGPAESWSCHQDLLQVLVFLALQEPLLLQEGHEDVPLLHHLQHLLQDEALLLQLPLLLQVICSNTNRVSHTRTRTSSTCPGVCRDQVRVTVHSHPVPEVLLETRLSVLQLQLLSSATHAGSDNRF